MARAVTKPVLPELPWIATARSYLGLREIPGKKHAPAIVCSDTGGSCGCCTAC